MCVCVCVLVRNDAAKCGLPVRNDAVFNRVFRAECNEATLRPCFVAALGNCSIVDEGIWLFARPVNLNSTKLIIWAADSKRERGTNVMRRQRTEHREKSTTMSTEECAKSIERAMNPPLGVFRAILKLIAKLVFYGERQRGDFRARREAPL